MKYLPSKAIKFWWFYRPLDLSDKLDQLIFIFTAIKVVEITYPIFLNKFKEWYKNNF